MEAKVNRENGVNNIKPILIFGIEKGSKNINLLQTLLVNHISFCDIWNIYQLLSQDIEMKTHIHCTTCVDTKAQDGYTVIHHYVPYNE